MLVCSVPFQLSYFQDVHGRMPETLVVESTIVYFVFIVSLSESEATYQANEMATSNHEKDIDPKEDYD